MILEIKSGDVTITSRSIKKEEFRNKSIFSFPLNSIAFYSNAYLNVFGLDISDYGLNEWTYFGSDERFVVFIRPDDLVRLRSNKLDLLID